MTDNNHPHQFGQGSYLAMDTSTSSVTLAIMERGKLLGELNTHADRNHSTQLMPNIQNLLTSLGLRPRDLRAVAVGKGPGSYTGVRIGVTVAKTFAWSLGIDLVSVSSLEAMALGGRNAQSFAAPPGTQASAGVFETAGAPGAALTRWYIPLMDARRGQAFTGLYEGRGDWTSESLFTEMSEQNSGEKWRSLLPDGIRLVEAWLQQLKELSVQSEMPDEIVFLGEIQSFEQLLSAFSDQWSGRCRIMPHELAARDLGLLAYPRLLRGEFEEVHAFVPNYTQLPEAEVKLLAKAQRGEG